MSLEQRSEPGSDRRHERHAWRVQKRGGPEEFFSIDMEGLSPRAQAITGLVVGGGILAGAALVLALNPAFFWLIFVFGWMIFPAFGLFARGALAWQSTGRCRGRRVARSGSCSKRCGNMES